MNKYAWLWAGACVSLSFGAQYLKTVVGVATECHSLQSSQEPSTAIAVDKAASEIRCAIRSSYKGAKQYMYSDEDGTCIMIGEGVTHDSRSASFVTPASPEVLEEIATGKKTYASPHLEDWTSDLAVDNNEADASMYHSGEEEQYPWWVLDLNQTCVVYEVQILPRRECCASRFHHIEVRVGNLLRTDGNFSSYKLFSTYEGPYDTAQERLACARTDGVAGRYLSIQRATPEMDALQITDVNVIVKKL